MPRKSHRKGGSRRRQSGGSGESQAQPAVPQISQATLQQAGKMAQDLLTRAMSQGSNSSAQTGGSAQSGGSAQVAAPSGAAAPAALDATSGAAAAPVASPGIQAAMTAGAVGGAVAGAEAYSSLHGSPIMGGGRRRGRGKQSKSSSQPQKGGMIPGLMTAVETALVPLGLYLGQKALQSRRSGSRSLGKSFSFRRGSRRTRRRN